MHSSSRMARCRVLEELIDEVQGIYDNVAEIPDITPEQRDLIRADAKRLIHTMEAVL